MQAPRNPVASSTLASDDRSREKFKRICGMLGSDGGGERANAAALATRLLRDAGLTWADIVDAALHAAHGTRPTANPRPQGRHKARTSSQTPRSGVTAEGAHVMYATALLNSRGSSLTQWEHDFLTNLVVNFEDAALSEKQFAAFVRIFVRLGLTVPNIAI